MRKVCADVFHAKPVDEELAQFVDAGQQRCELLAQIFVAQLLKEAGILIANHGHAGRGGNDDRFRVLIDADKTLGLREGFGAEAGIGVHLAAAGLLGVKIEVHAEPLQQAHHRPARLRKERVVIAGDKERRAHGWQPLLQSALEGKWYSIERRVVYCNSRRKKREGG